MVAENRTPETAGGMTAEDLYALKWAGDARISPHGDEVVYVVTEVDRAENAYSSRLWVAPLEGGTATQLTSGPKQDKAPRWSPDGSRVVFVSNRTGKNQLFVIDRGGGEARQLTELESGASNPVWSPDAMRIAFVSRTDPERAPRGPRRTTKPTTRTRAMCVWSTGFVTSLTARAGGTASGARCMSSMWNPAT